MSALVGTVSACQLRIVSSAAQGVPAWSPAEYRAEPLLIPDLSLVRPDDQLAVFGTFNPVGPTLNVLGVLWLGDGRYLLVNWMQPAQRPRAPRTSCR